MFPPESYCGVEPYNPEKVENARVGKHKWPRPPFPFPAAPSSRRPRLTSSASAPRPLSAGPLMRQFVPPMRSMARMNRDSTALTENRTK